jgi:hypothetical protein
MQNKFGLENLKRRELLSPSMSIGQGGSCWKIDNIDQLPGRSIGSFDRGAASQREACFVGGFWIGACARGKKEQRMCVAAAESLTIRFRRSNVPACR